MKRIKLFSFLVFVSLTTLVMAQKEVPSVPMKTLEGKSVNLKDYAKNGKITVVSYWATWCKPCKLEIDAFTDIYEEWQEEGTHQNVEFIAISVDNRRTLAKVKPMVAQKGWPFTVLSDSNNESSRALNFASVPQTFLIDQNGKIVYSHSGYKSGDEEELIEEIEKLEE